MSKVFIICDSDGNPFFLDMNGNEKYARTWAFKSKAEAERAAKGDKTVCEFTPRKKK